MPIVDPSRDIEDRYRIWPERDAIAIAKENYEEVLREANRMREEKVMRPRITAPPKDPIDHPTHYSRWKVEPIEFIAINNLPWWLANVLKYTMRYDAKDGLQDLYKARSYLDMKIRETEGHQRFWEKPVGEERALNAK